MTVFSKEVGSKTLFPGTVAASSNAVPLSTNLVDINEVIIQSSTGNAVNVWVGNSTTRSLFINPGGSITLPVLNLNTVYVATTGSTATVGYLARS